VLVGTNRCQLLCISGGVWGKAIFEKEEKVFGVIISEEIATIENGIK